MEAIENKIRKLLALGERGGTEAEAEAAMNAAHRLLAEYNLDMDSIKASSGEKEEEIITDESTPSDLRNTAWKDSIYTKISKLYFCEVFFRTKRSVGERFYCVMGKPSNIAVVKYIAQYLINTCDELSTTEGRTAAQEMANEGVTLNLRAWRGSFKIGFSQRIAHRVNEQIAKAKAGDIKTSDGRTLMILPLYEKEAKAIELYSAKAHGKFGAYKRTMSIRSSSGYQAGEKAATNVNIAANGVAGSRVNGYIN